MRSDGNVRWLRARAEPVIDQRDAVIGLRGICQDVTDRHEAAEALRAAREGERSTARGSPF